MKPLKIDELKALQVGDWVWVTGLCEEYKNTYVHIVGMEYEYFVANYSGIYNSFSYSDYGTKWLAYKNKEEAESKITNGSILRMLSNVELADFLCSEDFQRLKMSYSSSVLGINDWLNAELTEEQAERRLAELRGEK